MELQTLMKSPGDQLWHLCPWGMHIPLSWPQVGLLENLRAKEENSPFSFFLSSQWQWGIPHSRHDSMLDVVDNGQGKRTGFPPALSLSMSLGEPTILMPTVWAGWTFPCVQKWKIKFYFLLPRPILGLLGKDKEESSIEQVSGNKCFRYFVFRYSDVL